MSVLDSLPPGTVLIVGGLLLPLLRGSVRRATFVALPLLSAWHLLALPDVHRVEWTILDYDLVPIRVDALSLVWGYVFHLAAFLGTIYALHMRQVREFVAGTIYAGSAIAAVFAGDLVTLFIFWEMTALTSVFLIWARPTHLENLALNEEAGAQRRRSYRAGLRYLSIHVGSGVLLLAGILAHVADGQDLLFDDRFASLGLDHPVALLLLLAFGIKAAFPLLHGWLADAYPESTAAGAVFLSAFTTKMAVYALARGLPGTEELIWIGAAMAVLPIFFAVLADDLRRVLAHSLNIQLGYMVVGVGIGTELSLNGTAAHAFTHVLYKALLFMTIGAVLYRTGTAKGSELGGLHRSMPWTTGFCIVAAASISAVPLFCGFISKSLILSAAAKEHLTPIWLALLFASAGALLYLGIKVPYLAFFGRDSGRRVEEAPSHMLLAMGAAATLCVALGIFPGLLYGILPHAMEYELFTVPHVVNQLQLLVLSALAFVMLNRFSYRGEPIYPPPSRSTVIDVDWIYRRLGPQIAGQLGSAVSTLWRAITGSLLSAARGTASWAFHTHGPEGYFGKTWTTGQIAFFVGLMLGGYLVFYLW